MKASSELEIDELPTFDHTATYSPDDNKLRLYPRHRLDAETFQLVKRHGFKWAPRQGLFVAPMWTPQREDLLMRLCGEIGDEDTSLVDRAADRAERFEEYGEKRAKDADRAADAAQSLAGSIPLGQPILIGHHSEKRARRDAEKIQNGMFRAVSLWKTSEYWKRRAAGALAHAKYKELPTVRARRIKKIEADARKVLRSIEKAKKCLECWRKCETLEQADYVCQATEAGYLPCGTHPGQGHPLRAGDVLPIKSRSEYAETLKYPVWTLEQVKAQAEKVYASNIAHWERWANHYENRLAYERGMLETQGRADLLEKKPRPTQLPLCNYRAESGKIVTHSPYGREDNSLRQVEMTSEKYAAINKDYKGTRIVGHSHRVRVAIVRDTQSTGLVAVFLTDSKTHTPPPDAPPPAPKAPRFLRQTQDPETVRKPAEGKEGGTDRERFEAIEKAAKEGVKAVSAPHLFPTPPEVADKVVALAEIEDGCSVLEPSAGTGNLLDALKRSGDWDRIGEAVAVEVSADLARGLSSTFSPSVSVLCKDFLATEFESTFDRVLMNPPFNNGEDIRHIEKAFSLLNPGGRLVAICADGPRQNDTFKCRADSWEPLPSGTFLGTSVRSVLFVLAK